MSGNLGFTTFVLSDATAAFDLVDPDGRTLDATLVHDVSLATLPIPRTSWSSVEAMAVSSVKY